MSIPTAALQPRATAIAQPARTQAAPASPPASVDPAATKATPAATIEVSAQARQAHTTGVPPKHKKGLTGAQGGASAPAAATITGQKTKVA